MQTCEAMARTYPHYGYDLVELPRESVEIRVGFILQRLGVAS